MTIADPTPPAMTREPVPWSVAWHDAHLGTYPDSHGFYHHHEPAHHFATEAQADAAGNPLAQALAVLISDIAGRFQKGEPVEVVDIGAGSGELLTSLLQLLDADPRLHCTAIDVRPRPIDLPAGIDWITGQAPEVLRATWPDGITGIVIAHEWLDDLPVDVVARDEQGVVREVLVDPATGVEHLGEPVSGEAAQWLATWWGPVRDRAEIGLPRDAAWHEVCAALRSGVAVAIDYAPLRTERESGRFDSGTLVGYVRGEARWPIPDGSMNITAHVALDACAAAIEPMGVIADQIEMIDELLPEDTVSPVPPADADPAGFLAALERVTALRALRERSSGYRWLRYDTDSVN